MALTLEALESMPDEERYGLLGNSLYPRVMGITGEAGLAGKVTGMLLELPLEKLHALVQEASSEASLAEVVKEAQAVLPSPASPDSITAASAQLEASRGDDKLQIAAIPLAEAFDNLSMEGAEAGEDEKFSLLAASLGWDFAYWTAQPVAFCCDFIAERLQERNSIIVSAVAEVLGLVEALRMLASTEEIQQAGGMVVPETGKPRSSGGIYLKLLKEATHLPADAQAAAVTRIKTATNDAKKQRSKKQQAPKEVMQEYSPSTISLDAFMPAARRK